MPPATPSPDSARPRTATTRAASSSDSIPATVAAAISPCEWPITASGTTPAARHTAASDTITAHSAGWATCAASSDGAPSAPASTSPRSQPTCGASARPHPASRAANTGHPAASSRPIPAHCAPCPANTNTVFPAPPAVPVTTPGAGSPAATAAKPAVSPAASWPMTTARNGSSDRVVASDQPTSAGSSPGRAATHPPSRPACPARPCADRPDTGHASTPRPSSGPADSTSPAAAAPSPGAAVSALSCGSSGSATGGSSTMTWTLVPLTPKDETPARRDRSPPAGQGTGSASSRTAPADQSTSRDGSSTCSVLGSRPCRSAWTILMIPAAPAAAWVCPMLDLTDPSHSGRSPGRSCP